MFGYSVPTEEWKRDVLLSRVLFVATVACAAGVYLASGWLSTLFGVAAPVALVSAFVFGGRAQRGYHAEKGTFPSTGGDD